MAHHRPISTNSYTNMFLFCVSLSAIIEKILNRETPVFRPVVSFNNTEDLHGFDVVMQRCWAENPSDRPSFDDVAKIIKKLNTGK